MSRKRSRSGSFGSTSELRRASDAHDTPSLRSSPQDDLSGSKKLSLSSVGDRGAREMEDLRNVMGIWTDIKGR